MKSQLKFHLINAQISDKIVVDFIHTPTYSPNFNLVEYIIHLLRLKLLHLEELRKLIDAINRSVVPPVCSAANRNPWFVQNTHATNFLCSIELICLICWLKIVMIIHV
ncbi:MAG: hypothetical protein O4808_14870, partial [Trichodesmium sp. St17_bin3_1_1]|nr:hypothetical protein [Trichodesmium sp. St17_bin3_1_1]